MRHKKSYILQLLTFAIFAMALSFSTSSCSKKTGCPVNEQAQVKTNKQGQMSKKKGKSNLFPKKMRKKMR